MVQGPVGLKAPRGGSPAQTQLGWVLLVLEGPGLKLERVEFPAFGFPVSRAETQLGGVARVRSRVRLGAAQGVAEDQYFGCQDPRVLALPRRGEGGDRQATGGRS